MTILVSLRSKAAIWWAQAFRDREVILRSEGRVQYFRLSSRLQKSCAAITLLLFLVPVLAGLGSFIQSRQLADHSDALKLYREAYVQVLGEARSYHEIFADRLARETEANREALDEILSARATLREDLKTIEPQLRELAARDPQARVLAEDLQRLLAPYDGEGLDASLSSERLDSRLRLAKQEIDNLNSERDSLAANLLAGEKTYNRMNDELRELERIRGNLDQEIVDLQTEVEHSGAQRVALDMALSENRDELLVTEESLDRTEKERTFLASRIERLEDQLSVLGQSQEAVVDRLSRQTSNSIDAIEQVLDRAGVDITEILANPSFISTTDAQGGPFIPGDYLADNDPALSLTASVALLDLQLDRWESLQDLVRSLPLTAPLHQYRVTSKFGARVDPVNNKKSAHYGVDLAAPMRSKVMATAPGRVVFAGWKGRYGRVIEIEHGYGIRTVYGHLKKIKVEVGQEVGNREVIGLLGSSGRSTGPHVHYEVQINSKAYDPLELLEAGQHFYKG